MMEESISLTGKPEVENKYTESEPIPSRRSEGAFKIDLFPLEEKRSTSDSVVELSSPRSWIARPSKKINRPIALRRTGASLPDNIVLSPRRNAQPDIPYSTPRDEERNFPKGFIQLQLSVENLEILTLNVPEKETLNRVLERVQTEKGLSNINFQFKIPGAGYFTDVDVPIGDISYFTSRKKRGKVIKLMLLEKNSKYSEVVKIDNVKIGSVIGLPICRMPSSDDIISFKQSFSSLRYQIRHNEKNNNLHIPINLGDAELYREDIIISLVYKNGEGRTKQKVTPYETADDLLKAHFKRFPESQVEGHVWSDYVFKVVGREEYIYGSNLFYKFDYVQRAIATKKMIQLTLVLRSSVEVNQPLRPYIFEQEELFLDSDHLVNYNSINLKNNPEFQSVWELDSFLKPSITINPHESINMIDYSFWVDIGLYDGETPLCKNPYLRIPLSCEDTILRSDLTTISLPSLLLKLCDLPRYTKLCISVNSRRRRSSTREIRTLGSVNCLLYNYLNELLQGKVQLHLWPGKANPMENAVSNKIDTKALVINLEFETFNRTIVFPDPITYSITPKETSEEDKKKLHKIINKHPLEELKEEEKQLIWENRDYCSTISEALPKFLQSVNKLDRVAYQMMYQYLKNWKRFSNPTDALELLSAKFPDSIIRRHAVDYLETLPNEEISDYLLALVQALKYECYHDCALSRFLLRRALSNRRMGHYFYWYLKSEIQNPRVTERFGLMLEAFLTGGNESIDMIIYQAKIHAELQQIASDIKGNDNEDYLKQRIQKLNEMYPEKFQLMLDPSFIAKRIVVEKCKIMGSKMKPLWLLFENADPLGDDMYVIFKYGDDLRQDKLTLQMFQIMDKLWKKSELDLKLNPYNVIATGSDTGLIEVVTNSSTLSKIGISQNNSNVVATATFNKEYIKSWLDSKNSLTPNIEEVYSTFTASCAGYCVATYLMGVGDRHNDNIMLEENGRLFHIDFGHILGNFKKKYGVERERNEIAYVPAMTYAMGGKRSENYQTFKNYCDTAHQIIIENKKLFINLLGLMVISGMPELKSKEDIDWMIKKLERNNVVEVLNSMGRSHSTLVNFMFHDMVHN